MGSVNKVILVGNLGRDAELRFTPGGAAIAKFSLATTEVWNDKSGQRQERTDRKSTRLNSSHRNGPSGTTSISGGNRPSH